MSQTNPTPPREPAGKRGRLATAVATAVDSVGGARRSGGSGVEFATQFAGGRVVGVELADDQVVVHLVAERLPLEPLAEAIRDAATMALRTSGDGRPVVVAIEELDLDQLPGGGAR